MIILFVVLATSGDVADVKDDHEEEPKTKFVTSWPTNGLRHLEAETPLQGNSKRVIQRESVPPSHSQYLWGRIFTILVSNRRLSPNLNLSILDSHQSSPLISSS